MGILPSLGAIVTGGAFALGFGVAGGALIADGAGSGDNGKLGEGVALSVGALGGAALATYGVVTWVLVRGSPFFEDVQVIDEGANRR